MNSHVREEPSEMCNVPQPEKEGQRDKMKDPPIGRKESEPVHVTSIVHFQDNRGGTASQ